MAQHSESGRIVIDVEPELKRRLYSALSLSGSTLKDWFRRTAEELCEESYGSAVAHSLRYEQSRKGHGTLVREAVLDQTTHSAYSKPPAALARRFTVVSLFSGCGGMDFGFKGGFEVLGRRYGSHPFDIAWANELSPEACKTYESNIGHAIHQGDIWTMLDSLPEGQDVLIGGFPCQDISVNGKRAGVNGTRSGLYKAMIEAIKRVKPKVFVAENVKALLRHEGWLKQVVDDFSALGYTLHYQLYQAADYGVPQTRERVFFVGTAPGVKPFVPPVPELSAPSWVTAKQAIGDLEDRERSTVTNHIWSEANVSPEQGNRRLVANRPGYTIRAECHGNIQFHYRLARRISMREAARIQTFPDRFVFRSGLRETERQVGNAVPPVLAWHVARAVLACLT